MQNAALNSKAHRAQCTRTGIKRLRRLLPFMVYGMAIVLWLLGAVLSFFTRANTAISLDAASAQTEGLVPQASGHYLSENADPKLIFENVAQGLPLRFVRLDASFFIPPGELDLYYTTVPGQGFSPAKRAIAAPQNDGSWLYTLPPFTKLHSLRIDLGTQGGIPVAIEGITLNPILPAAYFFAPSGRTVLGLLLWPALALCAIYTILDIMNRAGAASGWGAKLARIFSTRASS